MATARDLFSQVQRNLYAGTNIRMIPASCTLHVSPEDERWHDPLRQQRGESLWIRYEDAVSAGRGRRAARIFARWLNEVQADRLAYLREIARERSLRFDPCGRGPVVDRPTVHYRDRLPWYLTPVGRYADRRLPERTSEVVETWNGAGTTFDGLFIADEPVSSGRFPVHDLIGTISADGRTGDWFVLDRWAS